MPAFSDFELDNLFSRKKLPSIFPNI
jgi:hypothetical protein